MSVKTHLGGNATFRSWRLGLSAFLGGVTTHYILANQTWELPALSAHEAGVGSFILVMLLLLLGLIFSKELTHLLDQVRPNFPLFARRSRASSLSANFQTGALGLQGDREPIAESVRELLSLISRQLSESEEYTAILKQADVQLRSKPNISQLQFIIEHVVSHNAKMRAESEQLSSELNTLRSRTQQLNDKLDEVSALANIDDLTGLNNRRAIMKELEAAVAQSHSQSIPLALIIIDIDHFKQINDAHGHPTGDAVLKSFADIIASSVRQTDVVGRLGGEEFVLILPRATAGTALGAIARIQNRLSAHTFMSNTSVRIGSVTASFGVALVREGELATDLIVRADRKLYDAKKNGRNRAEIDTRLQA